MRRGDPAYRWLIEVRHNSDPPRPGAGSAIFFHVRRGPDRVTAGCTTMSEGNLSAVVQWLKADARPHYILLPQAEYEILAPIWKLPPRPWREKVERTASVNRPAANPPIQQNRAFHSNHSDFL